MFILVTSMPKNAYITSFLQVKINFLMVGHTHEDIDQVFSCIVGYIAKHNIRTLEGTYQN